MKFYFTGTGNSLYVAKNVSTLNEELISIAKVMDGKNESFEFELKDDESIGFIFPIYAWAPPKMVMEFINKLKFKNHNGNYMYFVATCGENVGETIEVVSKGLEKNNFKLNSGFSMVMPNNYVIMGDVNTQEEVNNILENAKLQIDTINTIIKERKNGVYQVVKGPVPLLLTKVINPLFTKTATSTKKFYANDNCIGCKLCEKVCNSNTIKVKGKPQWGKECTGCLACLHVCPTKAINYGKSTIKKGRYINPLINVKDMEIR